ncbi:response regulator [Azospirillum halopraeferens]|uniref:response regulator n=1 Tax=Azospirillum halopraeferens TaxID=34010 RepID=UPI0006867C96|nr:response regulator [Azospirillum halopraeferens]
MAPADPPSSPRLGIPADACYDVDALLVELSGDDGVAAGSEPAPCRSPEDLYASASRFAMADTLAEFLESHRLTPTELLHTVEPQRRFTSWYRRTAVLDRLARARAVPGRLTAAQRLEELIRLESAAAALTAERAHRGPSPSLDVRLFAATVAKLRPGDSFAGRYALDALLAAWLSESGSFEMKLTRLLALDADQIPPEGIEALSQIIGEILASPLAVDELFGWIGGLRDLVEAMARLWKGEPVGHPNTPPVIRRLATFIGTRAAAPARRGLELAIQHALTGPERLSASPDADPRAASAILDEMMATTALANALRVQGSTIGGERTLRILDARIARMLTEERLEAMQRGKTLHTRLVELLTFEGAAMGERSRRMVTAAVQRALDQRDFAQHLFEGARTLRARIKALSDLQRRIARSGLPDAMRDTYVRMLDETQFTFLRTNRVLARIAREGTPSVEEVTEFATLCAEGAFTEGKSATAVRELIGHHVRTTPFLRAFLARRKADTEGRAETFARFMETLEGAGTPLRSMGELCVLLADDEPAARSYVEMILRDLGIVRILSAEDGHAALTAFTEHGDSINLIVCDWKMPRLSGLEFLKQVRAARPGMPFLMVTALATMIAVEEAMAHDVTAYIAKPFSPEQLEEKVLVLVNR